MTLTSSAADLDRQLLELNRSARQALASGDTTLAIDRLRAATALEPKSLALWLNLAGALRQAGRLEDAMAAVDEALKLQPRDFNALLLKGALLDRAGKTVDAGRAYGLALLFRPPSPSDPAIAAALERAERVAADYRQGMAAAIDAGVSNAFGEAIPKSVARFVDFTAGRTKLFRPQPSKYYFQGLPSQEFFDRALFPWIEAFEGFTAVILEELQDAQRQRPELFTPYVDQPDTTPLDQWADLNRSLDWSAMHIIRNGALTPHAQGLFPKTLEALSLLPQPHVPGRTPSAMFSALRPHTKIPPHHGVSNARLVVHLPLIVPPGCGFRVGSETRPWEVGQAWVFDDTIQHEAWNDSDELRVILIADIWNVFMTPDERKAYAAVVAALDQYNGEA
jgi:aspartyl/asparaginyl beta-hydroxylase (cupin superfamily)